ncbi:MAG: M12 family metallo-peptidase, partial [Actinomycetota bacterium]
LSVRAAGDLTPARVLGAVQSGRAVAVETAATGPFRVRLRRTEVLAKGATFTQTDAAGRSRPVRRERFVTLEGRVEGDPEGSARLTVAAGWVAGVVHAKGRWYSVEPDDWANPRRVVVRPAGIEAGAGPWAALLERDAAAVDEQIPQVGAGLLNCSLAPCDRLRALIVLDADAFFRRISPSTCQARQVAVFNGMIGIYKRAETRIDLSSPRVNCRTAADLGPPGTSIAVYLERLRAAWNDEPVDRSAVQLSAGYSFPAGDPAGYAYLGGICARMTPSTAGPVHLSQRCSNGYSVYQAVRRPGTSYSASVYLRTKLAAHELGHNFNADHDPGSLCRSRQPLTGPIMCALLQDRGPNRFSAPSAETIRRHAEQNLGSITGT